VIIVTRASKITWGSVFTLSVIAGLVFGAVPNGPQPNVGLTWYTSSNPTIPPGVTAPIAQLLIRQDVPSIYFKNGNAATAWILVGIGSGGGGVSGSGTANTITKWTGATSIGNSGVTDNGATVATLENVNLGAAPTTDLLNINGNGNQLTLTSPVASSVQWRLHNNGATILEIDPLASTGVENVDVRFFRHTITTGLKSLSITLGGSPTDAVSLQASIPSIFNFGINMRQANAFLVGAVTVTAGVLETESNETGGFISTIGATSTVMTFSDAATFPISSSHCVATPTAPQFITADGASPSTFSCFAVATGLPQNCVDFTYLCTVRN
jgi:hypothetical protein